MPRVCTICKSPDRAAIDSALLAGKPYRYVASRYGTSTGALQRHKKNDITALVKAADERLAVADRLRGDKLHGQVKDLAEKAVGILAKAEASGDFRTALVAVREARGCLELIAKLNGELALPAQPPCVAPLFALPASAIIRVETGGQDREPQAVIDITPAADTEAESGDIGTGLPADRAS